MPQIDPDALDRILDSPVEVNLTLNDLRILISSLDAMAYFGKLHGEPYLDADGKVLAERLKVFYKESLSALEDPAL